MDASTAAGISRSNPRIVLVAVWMAASLLSIPVSLVIKFSGENGGWLTFMLMMFGVILVGIWVLLGLLPLFIRGDYTSKLAWAWVSLALVFIGFIVGNANLPDFGGRRTSHRSDVVVWQRGSGLYDWWPLPHRQRYRPRVVDSKLHRLCGAIAPHGARGFLERQAARAQAPHRGNRADNYQRYHEPFEGVEHALFLVQAGGHIRNHAGDHG